MGVTPETLARSARFFLHFALERLHTGRMCLHGRLLRGISLLIGDRVQLRTSGSSHYRTTAVHCTSTA
jgi:hypothetical protein